MTVPPEFMRGTLDMLLLQTLSWGPAHGYTIWRQIRERSGDALDIQDAALYQGLRRLEHKGLVAARWGTSENNRRARFDELTPRGRSYLTETTAAWRSYAAGVLKLIGPDFDVSDLASDGAL